MGACWLPTGWLGHARSNPNSLGLRPGETVPCLARAGDQEQTPCAGRALLPGPLLQKMQRVEGEW